MSSVGEGLRGPTKSMDSEFNSFVGSFHQPPNRISLTNFTNYKCSQNSELIGLKSQVGATSDLSSAPNTKALMLALKHFRRRSGRLELERMQAEDNLTCLSKNAAEYKKTLEREKNENDLVHQEVAKQKHDTTTHLNTAKARCVLLEKQLDYMRKMFQDAEMERKIVLQQQTSLVREKEQNQAEIQAKLDKLELLEKECHRLTATQVLTENKISQLTEKLSEEEHQRKLIQDKAAQLQTGLEVNRIMMSLASAQNGPKRKVKKLSGKKMPDTKIALSPRQVCLKAGVLPFVAGKSASDSHSVSANVQSVLHMMKHQSSHTNQERRGAAERRVRRPLSSYTAMSSTGDGLADILLTLQDELGQMSFEHQELLKEIQEAKADEVREDLERELDCLVKQMEIKSDQILKLKSHQAHVQKLKQKAQKTKKRASSSKPKDNRAENKSAPATPECSVKKSTVVQKCRSSLQLLRCAQSLRTSLKKDDIMWEK
ncbi:centrosomal protein CEP57L1 [Microcaecilia unicolor]|uniref:Centrosomal protein 57kDa-like protein 1 n=1 Tax=Microcaecilia unicolor TaxID=1415580 RepID=A0A6P7XLI3_9AMPH|nr:centrosomal protein CEP57L1 [Microcaecilia unicolor]